ncbi:MAG: ATP-binding protein [Gammaproteobacteria bacterium]
MNRSTKQRNQARAGKLRIGDDWNAITIIALSQSNPLKAVAEFVENSIDAHAKHITITRAKEKGEHYLRVTDDGDGIPRDDEGIPNFRYVATHICDSVKRRLKADGVQGIQGEFGIGLLSFWTVGEQIFLTSTAADGKNYQMHMKKGDPNYEVNQRRTLFPGHGTELTITPLLPGIRHFSGEKMQWYLASELRDRIRHSGVEINIIDRHARKQFRVEPRQFNGQLLHQLPLPQAQSGDIYLELYLDQPNEQNRTGLYRAGTRVLENIAQLDAFSKAPWSSGYLQGIIDVDFLNLTPGTRSGIIQDKAFVEFVRVMKPVEASIIEAIDAQKKAEEEQTSRQILRTIQKAFKEAMLSLPAEEYDWFDIHSLISRRTSDPSAKPDAGDETATGAVLGQETTDASGTEPAQKQFFEYAGPMYSVRISPRSCVVAVKGSRTLRAIPRDRSRKLVEHDVEYKWELRDGKGRMENITDEIVTYHAPEIPELSQVQLTATQGDIVCRDDAMITVTDTLAKETQESARTRQGLPGYTFERAAGALWRSRFDAEKNVVVINNGHRDFVYTSRSRMLKLRYISRLFAKEIVYRNFPGLPPEQLLERMIELSLYMEENLK